MTHKAMYLITLVAAASASAAMLVLAAPTPRAVPADRPADSSQQKFTDLTLTGCLVQGSAPTVFVLENAKTNPGDDMEKGRSYLLTPGTDDLDIPHHLNQEVTAIGQPYSKTAPISASRPAEKDLPKFSAKSLITVAEKCQPASR